MVFEGFFKSQEKPCSSAGWEAEGRTEVWRCLSDGLRVNIQEHRPQRCKYSGCWWTTIPPSYSLKYCLWECCAKKGFCVPECSFSLAVVAGFGGLRWWVSPQIRWKGYFSDHHLWLFALLSVKSFWRQGNCWVHLASLRTQTWSWEAGGCFGGRRKGARNKNDCSWGTCNAEVHVLGLQQTKQGDAPPIPLMSHYLYEMAFLKKRF